MTYNISKNPRVVLLAYMLMSSEATPQHRQPHLEDTQPASDSQIEQSLGKDSGKSPPNSLPSKRGDANDTNAVPSPTSPAPASVATSSGSKPNDAVTLMILVKFCCGSFDKNIYVYMLTLLEFTYLIYVQHFPSFPLSSPFLSLLCCPGDSPYR